MAPQVSEQERVQRNNKRDMRIAFFDMLEDMFAKDDRLVLILGDIGVYTARNLFRDYPDRVFNIGICEQATISIAAGLAKEGFRPIFYTIAPFAVERCLEQIKVDIGYQDLPVTIVSVGASYDYAALGCTHHCPADVEVITSIPNMRTYIPGSGAELKRDLGELYGIHPLYVRLSEREHRCSDMYNHWSIVQDGNKGLVIAVGNMLDRVILACIHFDVKIIYINRLSFEMLSWLKEDESKVAVVEPFYEGTTARFIPNNIIVESIGTPRQFMTSYGVPEDHDIDSTITKEYIQIKLKKFFND